MDAQHASRPTPATIKVAPRPKVTVVHNDRAPLTQSISALWPVTR